MAIREKTPRERAAMQFKAAGLGDRSAVEAARLMFQNGLPFESAAVLGQLLDEASTATPASISEAAGRYRVSIAGPRTTTAWGRPLQEATERPRSATESLRSGEGAGPKPPAGRKVKRTGRTSLENGVLMEEVEWYEPVASAQQVSEQEKPTHTAWGRKLED